MKTTIELDGQSVEITLTEAQIAEARQKISGYKEIKKVEDAFRFLGLDYKAWQKEHKHLPDDVQAYMKLTYIAKAINGGKWMDYSDTSVNKYYPYFYASGSGSGFSYNGCGYVRSRSSVGSRLCFETSEKAIYAGQQFLDIYNQYIN